MKKLLVLFASSIWGLLVFRLALGIHFPMEDVSATLQSTVEKSTNKNMQLEIGDLGFANLLGIVAQNATIYQKSATSQEMSPLIVMDDAQISLNPLSFILGGLSANFITHLMQGEIFGHVQGDSLMPSELESEITWNDLNLALLPLNSESFEGDLNGKVRGTLKGTFAKELPHKNSKGNLTLNIDGLSLSNAKITGFSVPDLIFTDASLTALFNNGKLEITESSFIAQSIEAHITGDIILNKVFSRSRLRLTLELTLGSEFEMLAKMLPMLKNNKVGENTYKLSILGTIDAPRMRGSNQNPKSNRLNSNDNDIDMDDEENATQERERPTALSPEDKRKQRRERIEQRKAARAAQQNKSPTIAAPDIQRGKVRNIPFQPVPGIQEDLDVDDSTEEIVEEPSEEIVEEEVIEEEPEPSEDDGNDEEE